MPLNRSAYCILSESGLSNCWVMSERPQTGRDRILCSGHPVESNRLPIVEASSNALDDGARH